VHDRTGTEHRTSGCLRWIWPLEFAYPHHRSDRGRRACSGRDSQPSGDQPRTGLRACSEAPQTDHRSVRSGLGRAGRGVVDRRRATTARALVFACARTGPAIRQRRVELYRWGTLLVLSPVNKILPSDETLHPARRRPRPSDVAGAAKLSPAAVRTVSANGQRLAAADRKLSVFEYALQWVLLRHLGAELAGRSSSSPKIRVSRSAQLKGTRW